MKSRFLLVLGAAAVALQSGRAEAQDVRVYRTPEPARAFSLRAGDENRAVLGITTSTGSARDTLGVLVSSVAPGGPAEKAGIEEGNRIAAVNGVNLRLAPADVGDWDMANAMSRRLTRELGKLTPGSEADLRVYAGGQVRSVKVKTVAYDSLYRSTRRSAAEAAEADDRAALGISLGSHGSRRDTLGILIMGLDDDGPAARAGLEEGARIAAINGVDLRVSRDDAGDEFVSGAKVRRLHRELEKVRAGDEVTLRVYFAGRTRDVRVKTVRMSELPRRRTMIFGSPGAAPIPPMAPMPPMNWELRTRDMEEAMEEAGRMMERVAPRLRATISRRVII
jgi:serine protease Do